MLRQALSHLRLARVGIVGLGWAILVLSGPTFAAGPVETCRQTIAEGLRILFYSSSCFLKASMASRSMRRMNTSLSPRASCRYAP